MKIVDTLEDNGVYELMDIEYTGNFTIKYYSKQQLELLQTFFGVRRSKFDMKLLEKRPEIVEELESFKYEKNTNR